MPSSEEIYEGLTAIANEWRLLAVAWHLGLAAVALAVSSGWRPSKRLFALILALPVTSVAALAWDAGNPFNGAIFAGIATTLVLLGFRLPRQPIAPGSRAQITLGSVFVGFGWAYPEFLDGSSLRSYLYEAPFGLIPCPTLSVLAGASLIFGSLGSRPWAMTVSLAALAYGVMGVFALGVAVDIFLVGAAAALSATVMTERRRPTAGPAAAAGVRWRGHSMSTR